MARLWHGLDDIRRAYRFLKATLYGSSEERVNACGGIFLECLDRVDVDAQGDRGGFVAQSARDGLEIDARGECERPERMPQIVEADVRDLRTFHEASEGEGERARLPLRPVRAYKYPVIRLNSAIA